MALKFKFKTKDEIPVEHLPLYAESRAGGSGWEHVEAQFSAERAVYQRIAKEGAGPSR